MQILLGALLMAAALVSGCRAVTDPAQCPLVNTSMLEGSSEIIVPNLPSYSNALLLCKKNHTFSVCKPIARIRNGTLIVYRSEYVAHFSVSRHGLMVIKATRFLIGEYQLKKYLNGTCLQRVFLDVLASDFKSKHYGVIAAAILLVLMAFAFWLKKRRGITAHSSTEVQNSRNESLHPVSLETGETRINTPSRESGKAANGVL